MCRVRGGITGWLGWGPRVLPRVIGPSASSNADGSFTPGAAFLGDFAGWPTTPGRRVTDGDFNADRDDRHRGDARARYTVVIQRRRSGSPTGTARCEFQHPLVELRLGGRRSP